MSSWITGPIQHGATVVGASIVPLSSSTSPFNRGVTITSLSANTGVVYVGAAGVTTSNGFPLSSGQSVTIEATSPSDCFVIASAAAQEIRWLGV